MTLFCLVSVIDGFGSFWLGSLRKSTQSILEFVKAPFLVLHFSCHTLMTFLMVLFAILSSIPMILLSTISVIRHQFPIKTRFGFWTWIWLIRHYRLEQEVACWFQYSKKLKLFCPTGLITLVILMWKWMCLFLKKQKSSFKMLRLIFSSKLPHWLYCWYCL